MSEIEKQFFEAFNLIKYKLISKYDKRITYGPFDSLEDINIIVKGSMKGFIIEEVHPQITDRMLLELICKTKGLVITQACNSIEQLKDGVLKVLINLAQVNNDIKHQVQEIFKENN